MTDNPAMHDPIILLTRPKPQAQEFADALAAEIDADIAIHPMQDIVICAPPDPRPVDYDAYVFTSPNGARAAHHWGLPSRPAYVVGQKTAAATQGDAVFCADGDSDDLVDLIDKHAPRGPLLYLHGTHVAGQITQDLEQRGITCHGYVAYDQQALPVGDDLRSVLSGPRPVMIPVFSPRSAKLLIETGENPQNWHIIAMSHKVAAIFDHIPCKKITIIERPNGPAMLHAVCLVYRESCI
jgi:uroporphyrinogen-III synthase